jgi:hypothetical protein
MNNKSTANVNTNKRNKPSRRQSINNNPHNNNNNNNNNKRFKSCLFPSKFDFHCPSNSNKNGGGCQVENIIIESHSNNRDEFNGIIDYSKGLKLGFSSFSSPSDNLSDGKEFFSWLISPLTSEAFFKDYFQKKPIVLARNCKDSNKNKLINIITTEYNLEEYISHSRNKDNKIPKQIVYEVSGNRNNNNNNENELSHYYSGWFDKSSVFSLLSSSDHNISYGRDIDITSYVNNQRKTHNPIDNNNNKTATETEVRKFFSKGCSVRFLCPQQFSDKIWRMCNLLDDALGMQVGE